MSDIDSFALSKFCVEYMKQKEKDSELMSAGDDITVVVMQGMQPFSSFS